jgi:hypothetical protein
MFQTCSLRFDESEAMTMRPSKFAPGMLKLIAVSLLQKTRAVVQRGSRNNSNLPLFLYA